MLFILSFQQPLWVKESWQVSELSLSSVCLFFFLYWNVPKKKKKITVRLSDALTWWAAKERSMLPLGLLWPFLYKMPLRHDCCQKDELLEFVSSLLLCWGDCAFLDLFISPCHSFWALSEKPEDLKKSLFDWMIAAPCFLSSLQRWLIDYGFWRDTECCIGSSFVTCSLRKGSD